jgi:heme exporter protein C
MRRVLPALVFVGMTVALWLVFVAAPTERQMGEVQRIFYFHVGSAWVAFAAFFVVAGASAAYLRNGSATADRLAHAAGEVGVLFCTLVLLTGPIWARPIWGVWWSPDPRLTFTVILWAIYASYLMLRAFGGEDEAVRRYAAVVGIAGVLAIPVIRVSVRLMKGIHPSVLNQAGGGSGLADPWMRMALYGSSLALLLFAGWLVQLRMDGARLGDELAGLRRRALEAREESA